MDAVYGQFCSVCDHNWRDHPGYTGESACLACVEDQAAEPCRRMVSEPLPSE